MGSWKKNIFTDVGDALAGDSKNLERTLGLDSFNKQADVAQVAAEDPSMTEEEKNTIREEVKSLKEYANKPPTAVTGGEKAAALGQALVQGVKTVDPNAVNLQKTKLGEIPTMPVTQIDESKITKAGFIDESKLSKPTGIDVSKVDTTKVGFDPNAIGAAQTYKAGQNVYQTQLAEALARQAQGQGPSVAEAQFKAANEANLAASLAQQASLRGGFDPAAARQIRQTAADLQAKAAQDAAQAKIQEQLNAQSQLQALTTAQETQKAEEGSQNIRKTEQDITKATTAAELANKKAQTDLSIANAAAGNSLALAQLDLDTQKTVVATINSVRAQDAEIQSEQAKLKDAAYAREFNAKVEKVFKQGDIDSVESRTVYETTANMLVNNMKETNKALLEAYNGNIQMVKYDVDAANKMLELGFKAGLTAEEIELQMVEKFAQQGVDKRIAQAKAKNAMEAAKVARANAILKNKREVAGALIGGGVDAIASFGGGGSGGGFLGGLSKLAMGGGGSRGGGGGLGSSGPGPGGRGEQPAGLENDAYDGSGVDASVEDYNANIEGGGEGVDASNSIYGPGTQGDVQIA